MFGGAKHMLEEAGVNVKTLDLKKLKLEYQELIKQPDELAVTYRNCEKEFKELNKKMNLLNQYINTSDPQKETAKINRNQTI